MRNSFSRMNIRIASGIMGSMMLFIVLFSSLFIAAEADHDCVGDDCPICVCIQQCENTLHGICDGTVALSSVVFSFIFILFVVAIPVAAVISNSPVSRKVRLNN
ncbi:MAG: hypothetical protein K6E62_13900 [Lachnospiraceae bacterium]|nr:hypothetical protein [Lachnospiraceae bacterium]